MAKRLDLDRVKIYKWNYDQKRKVQQQQSSSATVAFSTASEE